MTTPTDPMSLTPEEFEKLVCSWIASAWEGPGQPQVAHRETCPGRSGDYELDVVIEFEILGEAKIVVLVECKRNGRPVEREVLLALKTKLHEVGAHKAMVFSTAGFQSGAVQFAEEHGIATIVVQDGATSYITKAEGAAPRELPPWVPPIVGWLTRPERSTLVSGNDTGALSGFLAAKEADADDS